MSAKIFGGIDIPTVRNGDLAKSTRSTSGQQILGLFEELAKRYSVAQLKSDLVDPVTLLLLKRSFSPVLLPGKDPSSVAGEMYDAEQVVVSGGLSSLTILTEDVDERHEVFAGVSADVVAGRVRPGLTIRAPFSDGFSSVLNSVVGARLTVGL